MKSLASRIGLAIVFSTLIGTFLTLSLVVKYDWPKWIVFVAMPISGILAWCLYDLKKLGRGLKYACTKTTSWRPNWKRLGLIIRFYFWVNAGSVFTAFWLSPIIASIVSKRGGALEVPTQDVCTMSLAATSISFIVLAIMYTSILVLSLMNCELLEHGDRWKFFSVRIINPIAVTFWILFGIFWVLKIALEIFLDLVPEIPEALLATIRWIWTKIIWGIPCWIAKIVWQTFLYVHTTQARICFIDTCIAVFIGCMFGYVYWDILLGTIVGTILGPIIGILNYQIVSIRWLRLIPAKTVA